MTPGPANVDPASFRDPGGFVFEHEGRVFRAVRAASAGHLHALSQSGLLAELQSSGELVGTTELADGPLARELKARFEGVELLFEHERLPRISYPCEWTPTMLAHAAVLHLDVQLRLLERGFSLKDGSAYNVQFRGARPVFIDLLSIEAQTHPLWKGYGQFCRHFLFPLALSRHAGEDLRSYFLAHLDGLDVAEVAARLGALNLLRPSLLLDVTSQHLLQKAASSRAQPPARAPDAGPHAAEAQKLNLKRLRRLLLSYAERAPKATAWSSYARDNSYSDEAGRKKRAFVERFLRERRPKTLLDLGANTGEFSRLAAAEGVQVVAVDADEPCVDRLYRGARAEGLPILPLVVDLANPTPRFGFNAEERAAFLERMPCEAVLALALTHHLLVVANAAPDMIRELLARLCQSDLVVEWVGPGDPQFRSLLGLREDDYSWWTEARFEAAFAPSFRLASKERLSETRALFHFAKKA